ncbi:hypothetical protein DVH24_014976 [Malus domestica]|uniref:Uncharacterized protein n=1 Tax=Malus domestica TaxID=3750 RepID=A0A498K2K8_MALDO|nr:hypothetical protein DVH24_014976 [Malus domestica]
MYAFRYHLICRRDGTVREQRCSRMETMRKKKETEMRTKRGTERLVPLCFVPHLVRLKRVERAVPRDEFWVNFRSASPPETIRSTSVEHKIIISPSPSSSSLFPSEGIFAPSPFHPVIFRPVPFVN